jgi:hypothetical protein
MARPTSAFRQQDVVRATCAVAAPFLGVGMTKAEAVTYIVQHTGIDTCNEHLRHLKF